MGVRGGNAHNDSWYGAHHQRLARVPRRRRPAQRHRRRRGDEPSGARRPALLRPGRLDRHVVAAVPGRGGHGGIVRHHLGPDAVIDDAELARAARICRGMSPAEVEQAARDARRLARRTYGRRVMPHDLVVVLTARRLERLQSPGMAEVDRRVAIHEAGHAVALPQPTPRRCVHVDVDEGEMCTRVLPLSDARRVERAIDRAARGYGGRAVMLLGDHGSGVQIDLQQATNLAPPRHAPWGMGETLRAHSVDDTRWAIRGSRRRSRRYSWRRTPAPGRLSTESGKRCCGWPARCRSSGSSTPPRSGPSCRPRPAPERTKYGDRWLRTIGRRGRHPDPTP